MTTRAEFDAAIAAGHRAVPVLRELFADGETPIGVYRKLAIGTPGTFLGARLAAWVSQSVIRRGIVIVLTLTGLKMLGVPAEYVGMIGAAMLLLGPLVWGFVRQTRGLPAFDNNAAAWRLPGKE